jgi:hypothetical protein
VRQSDDEKMWCYDYSTLSKMFNVVVKWCDTSYRHKLRMLPLITHKLALFNSKILNKLHSRYPGQNAAANPPEAADCSLFGDGCRYRVSYYYKFFAF